jgi:hypothetical protein
VIYAHSLAGVGACPVGGSEMAVPASWAMCLGTLAHRAVLWPFMVPVGGERIQQEYGSRSRFTAVVATNVEVLNAQMERAGVAGLKKFEVNLLAGLVNPRGPSSASIAQDWRALGDSGREWVRHGLSIRAQGAAIALAKMFQDPDYVRLWSEVPMFALDGYFGQGNDGPTRQVADLLCFRRDGDVDIVDLKFGSGLPLDEAAQLHAAQLTDYARAVIRRLDAPERKVSARLLYVGRDGTTVSRPVPLATH